MAGRFLPEILDERHAGRTEQEAGYVLTFATDLATLESHFIILDAEDFPGDPIPQRLPLGLHGNWCPTKA